MNGTDIADLEDRLWSAADELRANSKLRASEYSTPVLGLIFLRYADYRFTEAEKKLEGESSGRRQIGKADYQSQGVLYLPEEARFQTLINLPEGENLGQELNEAMRAIEAENPDLKDVLPKTYHHLESESLVELLKLMNSIPMDAEGDTFGRIYEYFLGQFAMAEGQSGGEFYTPMSLVQLIVNIIEPYKGRILDPACGSGGMFVQSARFIEEHRSNGDSELSIYGQEKTSDTVRLCKMNLAVHGLAGDIRQGNTYYEPLYTEASDGKKFDYVMANPPFNVDRVDIERLVDDDRFPYGYPSVDNANYLWMQIFSSALNDSGRAGFVMANSASDARYSEKEIRREMVEDGIVDVIVAVSSNFFYTVTLPCQLWFLDKGKKGTDREDKVLFIDARDIYRQVNRTIRDFEPSQIEFLSNIVRMYRGSEPENLNDSDDLMNEYFPDRTYQDVLGLCKVASIDEIEGQGWSLNPGRYVGVEESESIDDVEFTIQAERMREEFQMLTAEAHDLEEKINMNLEDILDS